MLLPQASELAAVDAEGRARLTPDVIRAIVALVPDEWLTARRRRAAREQRAAYVRFLESPPGGLETFVQEAQDARHALI